MGISFNLDSINLMQIGYSEFIVIADDGNYSHNGCYTQANTMCASKRVWISCCDTIYTIYLSLCSLSADPNPFQKPFIHTL